MQKHPEGVEGIARDLEERGIAALKMLGVRSGKIEGPSPETDPLLSRTIAAEIKAAMARGGNTAQDWYTHKVRGGRARHTPGQGPANMAAGQQGQQVVVVLGWRITHGN